MPRYRYSGKNLEGISVDGFASAAGQVELEAKLLDDGVYLQSFRPALSSLKQRLLRIFRAAELTRVTRQLEILLKSRISVVEALDLVADQIKDHTLRGVFEGLIGQVESGRSLAESFRDYPLLFDDLYASMVEAGESSGRLDFAFDNIANYRERYEATTRKIKSAMAYPLLVVLVAILVVFALVLYVVPVFSSMYENFNAELPALTKTVVSLSNSLQQNIGSYVLAAVIFLAGLTGLFLTERFRAVLDSLLVHTPVVKTLTTKIIAARFSRTMGSLLTSGVDILSALDIACRTTGNKYVSERVKSSGLMLIEGKSLTEALETAGVFPKALLRLSASGEKTGQLGELLSRAAEYYESETDSEIATLTTLIEPAIIVVLGVFVAFILIAMYLPLFELVGTL